MTQKNQERRETVSIEENGRTYIGQLIISGTRKLRFTVEYKGKTRTDSRTWGTDPEELYNLRVMAELHLSHLVSEVEKI